MNTFNAIGIPEKLDWKKISQLFRLGLFASLLTFAGDMIFGSCGFHVPVCALVFIAKHNFPSDLIFKYAMFFILSSLILFFISFLVLEISQIKTFATGKTAYPKWCWIFSLPVGMVAAQIFNIFGNQPWVNALSCAWISVGNIWMFAGLLATMKKAQKKQISK